MKKIRTKDLEGLPVTDLDVVVREVNAMCNARGAIRRDAQRKREKYRLTGMT